jgi:hypothetical protein
VLIPSFQLLAALPQQPTSALPTNAAAIGVHRLLFPPLVVHSGAANLGLLMRTLFGKGTPRGMQRRLHGLLSIAEWFPSLPTATASLVGNFGHQIALQSITQSVLIAA